VDAVNPTRRSPHGIALTHQPNCGLMLSSDYIRTRLTAQSQLVLHVMCQGVWHSTYASPRRVMSGELLQLVRETESIATEMRRRIASFTQSRFIRHWTVSLTFSFDANYSIDARAVSV
jgi:hypothetical protein